MNACIGMRMQRSTYLRAHSLFCGQLTSTHRRLPTPTHSRSQPDHNRTDQTASIKKKEKKDEAKIKKMREEEFKKRQSRERDIKRERTEGFEKKIAGD